MKKNLRIVKIEEQIYCSIFGVICKKSTTENKEIYKEVVNKELIKTIKSKLR